MYNITFEEVRYLLILYPGKVEVFMHKYSKAVLYSILAIAAFFVASQNSWGQNITFAGVTHMVTPSGVYTNLGLGIDVDPDSVTSACVKTLTTLLCIAIQRMNFTKNWEIHSIG